jgi:hypothetical protein
MIKTFKIGEEALGGIVQITTRPRNVFEVKCLDYNTKEVVTWRYVHGFDELEEYCEDISTPYWADKIVDFFKDKL